MPRITQKDCNVTKLFPSGAYAVSCIVGNRLVMETYYFTTKRDAVRQFVAGVNAGDID